MERFAIDASLPEKLKTLTHAVELVNDDGYVVAVVQPKYDPALYEVFGEEPTPEEIERRSQNDGWIPGDEIIPQLRKLA